MNIKALGLGGPRSGLFARWIQPSICLLMALIGLADPTIGIVSAQQRPRNLPNDTYFRAFSDYFRGDYRRAGAQFRRAAGGGRIDTKGAWVDHVCYHTMMGECYYKLGDLGEAMNHYDYCLQILLNNSGWLSRAQFPDSIQASTSAIQKAEINWGDTSRDINVGNFPNSVQIMIGNLQGIEEGGVIRRPELRPVNVAEIMRCTALTMRRRLEILGPTAGFSSLNRGAVDALRGAGVGSNHWARAWIDIPVALGLAAEGDVEQAAAMLQSSTVTAGFDHPLTPIALLELGKIYFAAERYDEATALFLEATFSAAIFEQFDVQEEAFLWGTRTWLTQKGSGLYPPLANAMAWAGSKGSRQLVVSLALQAADCSLAMGATGDATGFLDEAGRFVSSRRSDLAQSPLGAKFKFLSAHAAFQLGNVSGGVNELATAMQMQTNHGRWHNHLVLADQLLVSGAISDRPAWDLLTRLLRDPTDKDWQISPFESMSMLLIPHDEILEHYFDLAVARGETEKAIEISDKIRRQRFYNAMPLGGRVMALRWMLEAPQQAISADAQRQRQEFLLRYPQYEDLSKQSREIHEQLQQLPLMPEASSDERAQQNQLLDQLAKLAGTQESLLADIAMRREPAKFEFPPTLPTNQIQSALTDKQVLVAFFSTSNAVYVFRLTKNDYGMARLPNPAIVRRHIALLLRGIGNIERNYAMDEDDFTDTSWLEHGFALSQLLFPEASPQFFDSFEELIVVPDGILWYLPFELLQIGEEGATENLAKKINIRYVPTVSLAVPDQRNNQSRGNMAVVTGRLFPRDDPEVAQEAYTRLQGEVADTTEWNTVLPGPSSLLSTLANRVIVYDEIDDNRSGVFGIAPLQIDRGKPGSTLGEWMSLPWGNAEQIVLPGLHTQAESSLKNRSANGTELFLATCAMMASGTRTAMISRWRVGGQSAYDLMHEFARELPNRSAGEAWRRSLDLFWQSEIVPDVEPRIKESIGDVEIDPEHPFFWAGYMLLDTGVTPVGN